MALTDEPIEWLERELRARANARHSGESPSPTADLCLRAADALTELHRYAALGQACERHGLGWYNDDGEMRFQAPADVIEDQSFQKGYDAAREERRAPQGSGDVVTYTISIGRNGDVTNDTQTHGSTFAEVYRAFHAIRAEVDRQIIQRRDCPYNPINGSDEPVFAQALATREGRS